MSIVTESHVWCPPGVKTSKPLKQYQPVTFTPDLQTSSTPRSRDDDTSSHRTTSDMTFHKTYQNKTILQILKGTTAPAAPAAPAALATPAAPAALAAPSKPSRYGTDQEHGINVINHVACKGDDIGGHQHDEISSIDVLSSILNSNEDTDSNFSEDYLAILTNEPLSDGRSSSNDFHKSWFNYLKFKSQKEDLKNSSNHVHSYPYIEISSSIRKEVLSKSPRKHNITKEAKQVVKEAKTTNDDETCKHEETKNKNCNEKSITRPENTKYKMEVYKNQPIKIEDHEPGLKSSICSTKQEKGYKTTCSRWYESDADVDYRNNKHSNKHNINNDYWNDSGYLSSTGIHDSNDRLRRQQMALSRETSLDFILSEEREVRLRKEINDNMARRHHDVFMPKEKKQFLLDRYNEVPVMKNLCNEVPLVNSRYNEVPVMSNCNNSRIKGRARVLFTFRPQHENELYLKKGDIVQLLRRVDCNWFKGQIDGRVGMFPSNYVDIIVSLEEAKRLADDRAGRGMAIFEFTGRSPLELSLKKGDELMLIRRIDKNWFEGRLRGKQGIFPSSYVDVVRPPSSRPITPAPPEEYDPAPRCSSQSSDPLLSFRPELPSPWDSDAYESEFEREYNLVPPEKPMHFMKGSNKNMDSSASNFSSTKKKINLKNDDDWVVGDDDDGKSLKNKTTDSRMGYQQIKNTADNLRMGYQQIKNTADDLKYQQLSLNGKKFRIIQRCRALYNYDPQNDDELMMKEGDVMGIVEKCGDGWFIGIKEKNGQFGTFPGNYVQIIS